MGKSILYIFAAFCTMISCIDNSNNSHNSKNELIDSLNHIIISKNYELDSLKTKILEQASIINKFENPRDFFRNIEIVYKSPDFSNPEIRIYSSPKTISDSFETKPFIKQEKHLKENFQKQFAKYKKNPKLIKKNMYDFLKFGTFYITILNEFNDEQSLYDVLIWKQARNFLRLVSHYPEFTGGLNCGVSMKSKNDTLIFTVGNSDAEDISGHDSYFLLSKGSLILVKTVSYNGYQTEGKRKLNNKISYYENGNLIKQKVDILYEINGKQQYIVAQRDSINLLRYDPNRMQLPFPLIKKVVVNKDSLKYAHFSPKYSLIYWDKKWYLVDNSELKIQL